MAISKETLNQIALTEEEYSDIVRRLDREPNPVELGMFGALWSEHCGYKHSKQLIRTFPSESPHLLTAPGQENAGVIDIGDGLAAVIKVESHNHPSAVEPYQGAATGVGGIVRDILAMGARPIALLNSLRFGPLTESRNRRLFQGVVSGISGYGNCIGVPDVGGEIAFDSSYSGNPLVNALCVGIVPSDSLVRAVARTPGYLLVLVGAETGRDGIHGASGLASRTFEEETELRPTVQVGNPFMEKVLIEACLEVARSDLIEGMQDLGAAGLTSSTVEATTKGGTGFRLDVSLVPRRESDMSPYEVMLSESQERMLLILHPNNLEAVRGIMDKWDIPCTVIGEVTRDGMARIFQGEEQVGIVPGGMLTHPPLYNVAGEKPQLLKDLQEYNLDFYAGAERITFPGVAKASRFTQHCQQGNGVSSVRPPSADQHCPCPGSSRCRSTSNQSYSTRNCSLHRLQRPHLLLGPLCWRRPCRCGSLPQRVLHRSNARGRH